MTMDSISVDVLLSNRQALQLPEGSPIRQAVLPDRQRPTPNVLRWLSAEYVPLALMVGETPTAFNIARRRRRGSAVFLYTSSGILSAHFLTVLSPGRLKSGQQVRSSDSTSYKFCDAIEARVFNGSI